MPFDSGKVGRPRPARETIPVSRREFDELVVQVRRSGELRGIVKRLVQHIRTASDRVADRRSGRGLRFTPCGGIGLPHATPTGPLDRSGKDEDSEATSRRCAIARTTGQIVERNTERISRLEDVFALQVQQREEVTRELKELRADIRRGRR